MPEVALRVSTPADDAVQASWVASAFDVERFAGPSLTFPLTPAQLQAHRDDPDAAVAWARAQGFEDMTLAVFKDNAPAIRTYEALGFTERGENPDVRVHELRARLTAAA
jgi:GNAT superfamily N-acetyltransferase